MKYELIWYDTEGEKARDIIEASNEEDARTKGFLKYNGSPPAELVSIIKKG